MGVFFYPEDWEDARQRWIDNTERSIIHILPSPDNTYDDYDVYITINGIMAQTSQADQEWIMTPLLLEFLKMENVIIGEIVAKD